MPRSHSGLFFKKQKQNNISIVEEQKQTKENLMLKILKMYLFYSPKFYFQYFFTDIFYVENDKVMRCLPEHWSHLMMQN